MAKGESFAKRVGRRMRIAREAMGLQQGDVASAMRAKEDTYGSWERGYRLITTDRIPDLCRVLRRPPQYFLGLPDSQELGDDERFLLELFRSIAHPAVKTQATRIVRDLANVAMQLAGAK